MTNKEHSCEEMYVHNEGSWPNFYQCTRAGRLFEDAKWWCKSHAPSTLKSKKDKMFADIAARLTASTFADGMDDLAKRALALVLNVARRVIQGDGTEAFDIRPFRDISNEHAALMDVHKGTGSEG